MIEAMACGTPVLAFRCGSVPEIIEDGVTGAYRRHHGGGDRGAAAASWRSTGKPCGSGSKQRFSATRMAKDYVSVYRSLLAASSTGLPTRSRHRRCRRSRTALNGTCCRPSRLRSAELDRDAERGEFRKRRSTFRPPVLDAAAPHAQAWRHLRRARQPWRHRRVGRRTGRHLSIATRAISRTWKCCSTARSRCCWVRTCATTTPF